MPRLGHKKSRNGCRQCKARHVKCDENKPCSNCTRHGVLCSLVDSNAVHTVPTPNITRSSNAPKRETNKTLVDRTKKDTPESLQSASLSAVDNVLNSSPAPTVGTTGTSEADSPQSGSDTFSFIAKFVHKREPIQANLWLRDLELLHQWMVESIDSFSQKTGTRRMWRTNAPREAVKNTFLMHETLAFAALHIASIRPDEWKEYYDVGIHHQDHALRGMRKALKNITEENASALFAASTLITVTVMSSRGFEAENPGPNTQPVLDDLVDVFALVKGIGGVIAAAQINIMNGPFRPIFMDTNQETPSQPVFPQLLEHLPELKAFIENHKKLDEDMRREFVSVITLMRNDILWASKPCTDSREMRFLFFWPLHLSANFFDWLRQRHEGALVILMHWAVVLYVAEPIYWFLRGWADRVMNTISESVVDPECRRAMRWPLHFIKKTRSTPPQERPTPPPEGYA